MNFDVETWSSEAQEILNNFSTVENIKSVNDVLNTEIVKLMNNPVRVAVGLDNKKMYLIIYLANSEEYKIQISNDAFDELKNGVEIEEDRLINISEQEIKRFLKALNEATRVSFFSDKWSKRKYIRVHTFQSEEVLKELVTSKKYIANINRTKFRKVIPRYKRVKKVLNDSRYFNLKDDEMYIYGFCNMMDSLLELDSTSYKLPEIKQFLGMNPSERILLEFKVPSEYVVLTDSSKEIYRMSDEPEDSFIIGLEDTFENSLPNLTQVMLPYLDIEWLQEVYDIDERRSTTKEFDHNKIYNKDEMHLWRITPRVGNGIVNEPIALEYSQGIPKEWTECIIERFYRRDDDYGKL